jgi:hypothetical protein
MCLSMATATGVLPVCCCASTSSRCAAGRAFEKIQCTMEIAPSCSVIAEARHNAVKVALRLLRIISSGWALLYPPPTAGICSAGRRLVATAAAKR